MVRWSIARLPISFIAYTNCIIVLCVSLFDIEHLNTDAVLKGGVACLIFNVSSCEDVVSAFMQKLKKRAFTKSEDPDETPHNAASHHDLRYLSCLAYSW